MGFWVLQDVRTRKYLTTGWISAYQTLEWVEKPDQAKQFEGAEYAISYKNNVSHIRHVPMDLIEIELVETNQGRVPLQKPDWDDFDQKYDDQRRREAEKRYDVSEGVEHAGDDKR